MSGGSFNYLCDSDDLSGRTYDIERMAARLDSLADDGVKHARQAAQATKDVLAALRIASTLAERIRGVWHDVEWMDSCDYALDDVVEGLAKWSER